MTVAERFLWDVPVSHKLKEHAGNVYKTCIVFHSEKIVKGFHYRVTFHCI